MKGNDNMSFTGVYPVYNLKFKIGVDGRSSESSKMKPIAELETFSIAIDGKIEEWNSMDEGNDYVAGLAWKNGRECDSKLEIEFPEGAKLSFNCVVNVTNIGGGDSTNVAPLEFEVKAHGKPTFTPAPGLES